MGQTVEARSKIGRDWMLRGHQRRIVRRSLAHLRIGIAYVGRLAMRRLRAHRMTRLSRWTHSRARPSAFGTRTMAVRGRRAFGTRRAWANGMTRSRIGAAACAGVLALSGTAFAQGDPAGLDYQGPESGPTSAAAPEKPADAKPDEPRGQWYGSTIIATDAAGIALMATGIAVRRGEALALGWTTYTFGAPTVHAANDRPGAIFPSVLLRLSLPIALAFAGASTGIGFDQCSSDQCTVPVVNGVSIGWTSGMLLASAFDIATAYRPVAAPPPAPATARVSLAPFVDPRMHGGGLQLHGAF
jgi:hypothetical protein